MRNNVCTVNRTLIAIAIAIAIAIVFGLLMPMSFAAADVECEPAWHPFTAGGQTGVGSALLALTVWYGSRVAGGQCITAGGQTVNRIAKWGTPEPSGPADLNCDGMVDGADLLILLSAWGTCADTDDCPADINNDGTVDGADVLILLSTWG